MAEQPIREDEDAGLDKIDRFVLIFVREQTLWPVLIVIVAHIVVFIAPVMLIAVRELRPSAIAMMGVLLWGTFNLLRLDRRRTGGRFGQLGGLTVVVWVLAVATAVTAHVTGIF